MSSIQPFINFVKNYYALLIGIAIVSILSALTFHGDFYMLSKMSERIAGGNFHIYDNLIINNVDCGKFIMPPLIFLLDGALFYIYKVLHLVNFSFGLEIPSFIHALILKSRYILLFVLSYPLVKRVALAYTKNDKVLSNRIANIWITSPILLFLPFAQGNNDIFPVLFTFIFLFCAFKKKYVWAMIFLGLTAAMKNYALFLIPPMAIILADRDIKQTIKYGFISVIVYVLPVILYLNNIKLFFTGGGEGLFIFNTVVTSRINFVVFPIVYILLLVYLFFDKKSSLKDKESDIIFYGFLFMSMFYAISFFIPQWFLWILPFFVLVIYNKRHLFYLYLSITVVFLFSLITNWANNLDLNLFKPILPVHLNNAALPRSEGLVSLVSSVFVGFLISFIYMLFRERNLAENPKHSERVLVFLNLLPLILYLTVMGCLAILSAYNTGVSQDIKNKVGSGDYETLQLFNRNTISSDGYLENASIKNGIYTPSTTDPLVILPLKKLFVGQGLYAKIDFGDAAPSSPQVYWANQNKGFSEKETNFSPILLEENIYLFPLEKSFLGTYFGGETSAKYLRIDPSNTLNKFQLDEVSIIKL